MSSIIFNAVSGLPINNGSSIYVSIGKKTPKYTNNNNVNFNLDYINSKYQNKFLDNNVEYNLWHGDSVQRSPDPSIMVTRTPTPTVTPTATSTSTATSQSPTPTLTPSQTTTAMSPVTISLTTNTANFGNCGGNVSNVGTNGISTYYGAYDMAGNVWEWTETPVGASSRVFRGGNYGYSGSYLSSSNRNYTSSLSRVSYLGFRIASKQLQLSPIYSALTYVGDSNNIADTNGFGSLSYPYYIGKNEITNEEYIEFLNAVATTDTNALYINSMSTDTYGGILRSGFVGSYSYSPKTNMSKRPVNYVNWASCARYCNWLHNGKPTGQQGAGTTENGAYNMSLTTPTRDASALYFLATENEWYKAAFYKGNGLNSGYWLYPTRSNTIPSCVTIDSVGNAIV